MWLFDPGRKNVHASRLSRVAVVVVVIVVIGVIPIIVDKVVVIDRVVVIVGRVCRASFVVSRKP